MKKQSIAIWIAVVSGFILLSLFSDTRGNSFARVVLVRLFPVLRVGSDGYSHQSACVNNLRMIDGAKQQWALEHKMLTNAIPTKKDLQPYLGKGTQVFPSCPLDGKYSINAVTVPPTCTATYHILPPAKN